MSVATGVGDAGAAGVAAKAVITAEDGATEAAAGITAGGGVTCATVESSVKSEVSSPPVAFGTGAALTAATGFAFSATGALTTAWDAATSLLLDAVANRKGTETATTNMLPAKKTIFLFR